ncbi:MAG: outer membrane protein TolC [Crocinitomicaceae bacterium]|jgi:outer membrane protein TolC
MRVRVNLIILLISSLSYGQDTLNVLMYDDFIEQVMLHHPTAFRADIIQQSGEASVLSSRGQLDPKLFGEMDQKYFKNNQYYSHAQGGIKIPTWFGVSAEAGYEINDGVYLNPENRTPNAGLWYAGLRLELGQGLIMNARRAEFEKAKVFRQSTKLEQKMVLNELKRDASFAYWKWCQSYQKVKVYQEAVQNAQIRFEGIKNSALYGDRPYIDTIEAYITVQNRSVSLSQAQLSFQNAELLLEVYLWDLGFIPLELENTIPQENAVESDYAMQMSQLDSLIISHPYLQLNALKLEQIGIDLKLKKEQLKPKLSLKYNALSEPMGNNPLAQYSPSDYSWGASFLYPILSRKERGDVQLAKLKVQDQELANTLFETELGYKINSALNNYLQSTDQLLTFEQLFINNEILYDAEKNLFDAGESSVFMINSRESNLLKATIELIEAQNKVLLLDSQLNYILMLI